MKWAITPCGNSTMAADAEDLPDAGYREPAAARQPSQVGGLVVAGQDGPVVAVQVSADSYVARADQFGEPDDLGAGIGQGPRVARCVVAKLAMQDDHMLV
jgi:hypothetical protein